MQQETKELKDNNYSFNTTTPTSHTTPTPPTTQETKDLKELTACNSRWQCLERNILLNRQRKIRKIYEYVKDKKDAFGYNYEEILFNLETLYSLDILVFEAGENQDQLNVSRQSSVDDDDLLDTISHLSDILFFQENLKENNYMSIYNSLQDIYLIRYNEKIKKKFSRRPRRTQPVLDFFFCKCFDRLLERFKI